MGYKEIINEQLRDGIIEEIDCYSEEDKQVGYFMPHHGVVRELKESTKLRICYDASSKAKNEISLNDCLDCGTILNPDLSKIILKFRYHPIAFCSDIQRAFLEVGIAEEYRKYLQILFGMEREADFDLGRNDIRILRFKCTLFGDKCSPFMLAATLRLHIKKYENSFPDACDILNELYVDDLLSGCDSVEKAACVSRDAIAILKEADMNLRQWVTNSPELGDIWKRNEVECKRSTEECGVALKVLGFIWDNDKDILKVSTEQFRNLKNTSFSKRLVLKAYDLLFDPMGLLAPFTIRIKLLMQLLWEMGISWDEPLPENINLRFQEWLTEVENIQDVTIPQKYFENSNAEQLELHLFLDASPKAYGAVAYLRSKYPEEITTCFVIAKSRVAPLKKVTLLALNY